MQPTTAIHIYHHSPICIKSSGIMATVCVCVCQRFPSCCQYLMPRGIGDVSKSITISLGVIYNPTKQVRAASAPITKGHSACKWRSLHRLDASHRMPTWHCHTTWVLVEGRCLSPFLPHPYGVPPHSHLSTPETPARLSRTLESSLSAVI